MTERTREQLVAEAWELRNAIIRRLILIALDRAKLERALASLDDAFAGQPIRRDEDLP
jgi:hypothetical protein